MKRALLLLIIALLFQSGECEIKPNTESIRNLFSKCLDSCRILPYYYNKLIVIESNKYINKEFDTTLLSEHDKKRIALLVNAEYEEWELDWKVAEHSAHLRIDVENQYKVDRTLKTLQDSVCIMRRRKVIADSVISDYKELIRGNEECNTELITLILKANWKQCVPMLESLYRKAKNGECKCGRNFLEYVLACFHVEPYMSNCIKRWGYNEEIQDIKDYGFLLDIGSPAALYEITKALRSTKKRMFDDEEVFVKYFFLTLLDGMIDGFPSIDASIDYEAEGIDEFAMPAEQMEEILKWVEENKDSLHYNRLHSFMKIVDD